MKLLVALSALFAGACCTSLPRLPEKERAMPALAAEYERIVETREVWRDEQRSREVPVTMYAPENPRGRLPVAVFSHGIGEDRDSYAYLGRALARHGMLAVHVTHAGTDRAMLERGYLHLYRAVKQQENWVNRPLDVTFVLDRLASRADANVEKSAIVGHSAGAFTAFALAGFETTGGESLRDPRVVAAVAMSMPRMDGVVAERGYDAVQIPVLNVTGTCDTSIIYRTFPKHRRIPFDESRAGLQYLITFEGVNHDTFVVEDRRNAQIAAVTVGFLRIFLHQDGKFIRWLDEAGNGVMDGVRFSLEH
jgi:predicted dienelactone hydrolase